MAAVACSGAWRRRKMATTRAWTSAATGARWVGCALLACLNQTLCGVDGDVPSPYSTSGLTHPLASLPDRRVSGPPRLQQTMCGSLQALGFTENDSAGQTNIFAVEPKTYVAGSSADNTSSGGQTTIIVAAVAAIGAAAAVAGGLLANSGPSGVYQELHRVSTEGLESVLRCGCWRATVRKCATMACAIKLALTPCCRVGFPRS